MVKLILLHYVCDSEERHFFDGKIIIHHAQLFYCSNHRWWFCFFLVFIIRCNSIYKKQKIKLNSRGSYTSMNHQLAQIACIK